MKKLSNFSKDIHKCSKCGLCQAACPIYKITGNDCTVSRGQFIMLNGLLKGDLNMTKNLNRYLDICLQCNACSRFCPSGINVVDIIAAAKHEYFEKHISKKIIAFIKKYFIFGFIPIFASLFKHNIKSKIFKKKVIYFGGCASKFRTDKNIVKILNNAQIQVINPNFLCCGISLFAMGDLNGFYSAIKNYIKIMKKYDIKEVVTNCASCEKTLNNYINWVDDEEIKNFLSEIRVKNVYEYIRENNLKFKLKKRISATFHKPCHLNNFEDIEWILNNTENLEYIEMKDFDKCCGLNGIENIKELPTIINVFKEKRNNIIKSGTKNVLSACFGCDTALKLYSFNKYKVFDLIEFIGKNIQDAK